MIILGERYRFLHNEISYLEKRFGKIYFISLKTSPKKIIKNIKSITQNKKVNIIIINSKVKLHKDTIQYLTSMQMNSVNLITIEHFLEKYLSKCFIDDLSVNYLENIHPYSKFQYLQKRVIDIIAVILLTPIAITTAIITYFIIKKESPGTIFYLQKRVGANNKEFKCIKFRSMHPNAEANGPQFAKEDDSRTYPWGKFLRDSKLDELGQLINVLKGEMHFVGPRPERKIWVKEFEKEIPYYSKRHLVKPGVTGLAQIKYQYGNGKLDAYQKLMYDLYYIKNWSLSLELKVILDTILFILLKKRRRAINSSEEFKFKYYNVKSLDQKALKKL